MRNRSSRVASPLLVAVFGVLTLVVLHSAQTPSSETVVVRAGRLFDAKAGTNLVDQIVVIRGDRITDVGPASRVRPPSGARVIDLSTSTVLPGLIDGHVHLTDGKGDQRQQANQSATASLRAGYTTLVT